MRRKLFVSGEPREHNFLLHEKWEGNYFLVGVKWNFFSRKMRRNSFLIDPKWTIFFKKKNEIAF
jgi:hypothetical protein